jgi:ribonuclease P protein subunit RPR2
MVVIARERIVLLMEQADRAALDGKMDQADRYVEMARRVGMRYNVRIPPVYRGRFCRACYAYMMPGSTARNRLKRGKAVTTCLRCGHVKRVPLAVRSGPDAEQGGSDETNEGG